MSTLDRADLTDSERLRLLDAVRDYAIYMLDPQGHVQSWNRGAELIKGYSAPEVIGKHYSMFFRQQDRAEGLPAWQLQRALLHGRTEEEGWRVRKNGTTFWANIVLTPIHTDEGELAGFAKVTRDMSERHTMHELEASLRRTNEFLAMLGHELRNPLAPMRNAVTLMQRETSLSSSLLIARDVLDRQLSHLNRLLGDLLDAGRLTSGKIQIRPERITFNSVVTQAVEAVWPSLNARSQVLNVDLPEGDIFLNADEIRLIQVVQNLLSNAVKFSPDGEIITLQARVVNDWLRVSVSDNGVGMEPATIDQLFVLFAQGEEVMESSRGGLGIGLALARSIVEMHAGNISGWSGGVGTGSIFTFELPGAALEENSTPSRNL
ncbi:PAS domain-containing sensor histidine kinase [Hydrogenophaga sp.]|uniref:PAS domain-containing sensor histidine kinase n=1 Tax=Hydrogenophaga sp. TaxID=1904254 RepID=UPI0025C24CD5|nr:PAS domain-containing sensor histidine kinase [Hydrogenophaga sp.]MBT9465596.1 PAS domain-containing sensor histidine kinase [Hydrogenophaga sp.]